MAKETDTEKGTGTVALADLVKALQQFKGDDDETMRKRAEIEAEAIARLQRRENTQHPDVSVFNPQGERDHPRGRLKCKMFWVGYELERDALSAEEIDLLNRINQVGSFPFHRTDGSREQLVIDGTRNANGQWERLTLTFNAKGDRRHNVPPLATILREALGLGTLEDDLRKRIAELEAIVA